MTATTVQVKLSPKQRKDLETVLFFAPRKRMKRTRVTKKAIEQFFAQSDRGEVPTNPTNGYKLLMEGKRWRGIHIHEMWHPGLQEGDTFIWELIEDCPKSVIDFLVKEKPFYAKMVEFHRNLTNP